MKEFGVDVARSFDSFVVKRQRYRPVKFDVEGDWSSASYFLALGALSEEGIKVGNIRTSSIQGDRVILDFLRTMGAQVRVAGDSVTVGKGDLKAIKADLSDCIDLLPTMAVLASMADGRSELTGIERARIKESNRIAAVRESLEKLGISVSEDGNRLMITGLQTVDPNKKEEEEEASGTDAESGEEGEEGQESEEGQKPQDTPEIPQIAVIDSHNDHRIAMAFGALGTAVGNMIIEGAECVSKTYPEFWNTLKKVGGQLEIDAE